MFDSRVFLGPSFSVCRVLFDGGGTWCVSTSSSCFTKLAELSVLFTNFHFFYSLAISDVRKLRFAAVAGPSNVFSSSVEVALVKLEFLPFVLSLIVGSVVSGWPPTFKEKGVLFFSSFEALQLAVTV